MKRDLAIAIASSAFFHVGVMLTFAWSASKEGVKEEVKDDEVVVIEDYQLPPLDPEDVKEEEEEMEEDSAPDEAQIPAASLPEPPARAEITAPITEQWKPTPPVPPRPDSLSRSIPTGRNTGGGTGTGPGSLANIFKLSELDRQPQARVQTPPQYPFELRRAGISGTAEVLIVVNEEGNVVEAFLQRSTHPEFGQAALDAVRKWKFRPGMKSGKPVKFQMIAPLAFRLTDE